MFSMKLYHLCCLKHTTKGRIAVSVSNYAGSNRGHALKFIRGGLTVQTPNIKVTLLSVNEIHFLRMFST